MATQAQKVRLGVFMILATLLFVGSVGTLAGLKLWNPKDRYFVRYRESVSGLEIGATVKMQGVRVGQVERVSMDDVETVRVVLSLEPGTPIKQDTVGVISSIGITGLKFIELTGGSKHTKRMTPNTDKSEIRPGDSVVQTLTGKAIDISTKMEQVLNSLITVFDENTRTHLRSILANTDRLTASMAEAVDPKRVKKMIRAAERGTSALARTAKNIDQLVASVGPEIQTTLSATSSAAKSIDRAAAGLRAQRAINELSQAARALRDRIEDPAITAVLKSFKSAATLVRNVSSDVRSAVRRNDRQIGRLLSLLSNAAGNLTSFSRSIKERPSLLLRGETVKERRLR